MTDGRFGDTGCLPVSGNDGKTVWIFKPEDLREVVPDDVYKCIEAFIQEQDEGSCSECERSYEGSIDFYRGMCVDTMNELRPVLDEVRYGKRLNRKKLEKQLEGIWSNLNKNL